MRRVDAAPFAGKGAAFPAKSKLATDTLDLEVAWPPPEAARRSAPYFESVTGLIANGPGSFSLLSPMM
jgi:hypothetical protein